MPVDNAQVDNVYTAKDLAERLRVDVITVYRWTRNGALKEGVDFFVLPHAGKRRIVRFTEVQYNRIVATHRHKRKSHTYGIDESTEKVK